MKYLILLSLVFINCGGQNPATIEVPGPQGPAGTPGTQITMVQFCPGIQSYSSTFNEVGICIQGNIWAVYSVNDGFLTLIPPGNYSSNGINSSCNFQVLPNCVIVNN